MNAELVAQVASVLGVTSEEAEQALEAALAQFRHNLATGGEARLPGVGVFNLQHSAIVFQPSEGLELAVNHRYAGLAAVRAPSKDSQAGPLPQEDSSSEVDSDAAIPIDYQPEFQVEPKPIEDAEADAWTDESVREFDEEPLEQGVDEDEQEDEPVADIPLPPPDTTERGEIADELSDEELDDLIDGVWMEGDESDDGEHPLGPPPPEIIEEADFAVVEPSDSFDADHDPPESDQTESDALEPDKMAPAGPQPPPDDELSEDLAVAAAPGFAATKDVRHDSGDGKKRRFGWWLAALLIIAVGVAAFWLVTQLSSDQYIAADDPPVETSPPVEERPVEQEPAPIDEPDPDPTPEPAPAQVPRDGPLFGSGPVDPAEGGVTFALSDTSQDVANQRAERYRIAGYRVAVQAATVRGMQVYRIFLGQFSSPEEAEAHRDDLPNDVPPDIWIHRL